jgi:hypothetical protein
MGKKVSPAEQLQHDLVSYKTMFKEMQSALEVFIDRTDFLMAGGSCFRAYVGSSFLDRSDVDIFLKYSIDEKLQGSYGWCKIGERQKEVMDKKYREVTGISTVRKYFHLPTKTKVDLVEMVNMPNFNHHNVLKTFDLNVSKYYWCNHSQEIKHQDKDQNAIVIYPRNKGKFFTLYERVYKYQKIDPSRKNVYFKTE